MTGAEYRAEFHRLELPIWRVAAHVGMGEVNFHRYLTGTLNFTDKMREDLDWLLLEAKKCPPGGE